MRDPELTARLVAARRIARGLLSTRDSLLVAAEATLRTSQALVAHAVPAIGDLSATKGLSLCERLAGDEVVVVPDLEWQEVPLGQRCPECDRSAASGG